MIISPISPVVALGAVKCFLKSVLQYLPGSTVQSSSTDITVGQDRHDECDSETIENHTKRRMEIMKSSQRLNPRLIPLYSTTMVLVDALKSRALSDRFFTVPTSVRCLQCYLPGLDFGYNSSSVSPFSSCSFASCGSCLLFHLLTCSQIMNLYQASEYALQFFPASCSSAELFYEVEDHFYKVRRSRY